MKKCPKCNTILDDSKNKCYMCGADLHSRNPIDFMGGFDDQIGAAVTKSQDNVFNNVSGISAKVEQVTSNNTEGNATISTGSSSADFYQQQMNNLNSMQYDERTAIEKIFSNDDRFRSKDEINAEEAMKNNKNNVPQNNPFSDAFNSKKKKKSENLMPSVSHTQQVPVQQSPVQQVPVQQMSQPVAPPPVVVPPVNKAKKEKKASINWGNNLEKSNKKSFFGGNNSSNNGNKFSVNFFLNTACFVLLLFGFIVVIIKNVGKDKVETIELGNLTYQLNEKFVLENQSDASNYYTYGENCVLRISYGLNEEDDFLDTYFNNVQEEYSQEDGYLTRKSTMTIGNNELVEITVTHLKENSAVNSGYTANETYKFVTILHNKKFYEIRFVNLIGDNECSSMYKDLINSLSFK